MQQRAGEEAKHTQRSPEAPQILALSVRSASASWFKGADGYNIKVLISVVTQVWFDGLSASDSPLMHQISTDIIAI